jgi:hypothetical protein
MMMVTPTTFSIINHTDTSDIFYIGDQSHYKSGSSAGKLSKYKQFTYIKNVIHLILIQKRSTKKKDMATKKISDTVMK